MATDTIRQLAAITDAAQFERIATSVLRSANPIIYGNLSHQGVNTEGKTVKAPLDNIGWMRNEGQSAVVAAAHTTCSRDDLEGKWLHDPTTVRARKQGGKPTKPAGDLIKAADEIAKLRANHPGLKATLALTTNREEPAELRVKAESFADSCDITLDIWSVSRIAQHLDTTPQGQAIRASYLGTQVQLVSIEALVKAGTASLSARSVEIPESLVVGRAVEFGHTGHVFIAGASGMGKSTLAIQALRNSLANGEPGIILSDQSVRDATSIEEAIETELRRHLPGIEPLAGAKAIEQCSELKPFVVVVEDINRAENTVLLLNKLAGWALQGAVIDARTPKSAWRLICPVWPRYLAGLEKIKEVSTAGFIHTLGAFSEDEATEAVKRRGERVGRPQNDLTAAAIAKALGCDPLLIGLFDFSGSMESGSVISEYVARELASAGLSAGLTSTDLQHAIDGLMREMLWRKCLSPTWRQALGWFADEDDRRSLRAIVAKGSVLRITPIQGEELVQPRHDRVLHALMANSIASCFANHLRHPSLSDPYFAEYVGSAATTARLPSEHLAYLVESSPLVAVYAYQDALFRASDYAIVAKTAIEEWLAQPSTRGDAFFSRRAHCLQILSEIDSPAILDVTARFPAADHHQSFFEARFRNGDLAAGLNWLLEYPFDVEIGGRQALVAHVRQKYGAALAKAVAAVLEQPTFEERTQTGALYLAGYLADPVLAKSVRVAWRNCPPSDRNLAAFLWAGAQVCAGEESETLDPICDAWEDLPEKDDAEFEKESRSSVAAYGLSWKFRDHPPRAAIQFFVQRANHSESLRWPITYMLRSVDDPAAVEHLAQYLAERSRQDENAGGSGISAHFLTSDWRRQVDERGRSMSVESKRRLLELSANTSHDAHLRTRAFSLWEISVSPGDLEVARAIPVDDPRHDKAVWARVRRQDLLVMPELLVKISRNPSYWWQAGRYLWTEDLTNALEASLRQLGHEPSEKHEACGEWIFPELLLQLDVATAERLLLGAWQSVGKLPRFVQVAFCVATPELLRLANKAVEEASEPKRMFEHFSFTAGLRTTGRAGLTREAQVHALLPHLALLSEHDQFELWEICDKRGWRSFRQRHLDPLLEQRKGFATMRARLAPPFDMTDLDNELSGKRPWGRMWLEHRLRDGADRVLLVSALLEWLEQNKSLEAMDIVAFNFSRNASRQDFERFALSASRIPGYEPILERTRFDVFNRSII